MLKNIIYKEIRENISSAKFTITFGLCSVLIILAFYTGSQNYKIAKSRYEAAKSENLRQLKGLTEWESIRDFRIFLPPQPLEAMISGVSNDIGRTIEINGRGELVNEDSRFADEPVFAIFRFLDIEFIFQIVLTLFAILFVYDAVNGEKEKGTLKLIFSNAVPKDIFILGKLSGTLISLLFPLMIPFLLGILILSLSGIQLHFDEWIKLILIILSGFLLVSSFVTLSIFTSAKTEKSSTSFLILLSIWIFAVIIIPRLSVITAGAITNVPALDEINSRKARFTAQMWKEDRAKMASYKPEKTEKMDDVMKGINKFMQELGDKRDAQILEYSSRLNEERKNKEESMHSLAFSLARVSPVTSFSIASSELANTSLKLEQSFHESAESYQKQYSAFLFSKTGMNTGGFLRMRIIDDGEEKKPINPNELPEFVYKPRDLNTVLSEAMLDIGILAAFNICFFAGAFFSFRKFDLR